jgi:hypothetical protein
LARKNAFMHSIRERLDIARLGVNDRFGGGTVMARYSVQTPRLRPGLFPCASGGNDGSLAGDPGGKIKTRQCQWVSTTNSANRDQRK